MERDAAVTAEDDFVLYLNLPTSCWIIAKTYFVSVNRWMSVWSGAESRHPRSPSAFASHLQKLQPENPRWCSVRVKRQRHLQAAELLPASTQDALHAVVPIGQPVGQVDVGQVEDWRGQRVRALREEETRGQVQRSEALWVIIISASVEPIPSLCRGSVILKSQLVVMGVSCICG